MNTTYGAYAPGETFTIRPDMPDVFTDPQAREWPAIKAAVAFRLRTRMMHTQNLIDRVYLAYNVLVGRL